jgi:hypothetical protein
MSEKEREEARAEVEVSVPHFSHSLIIPVA